MATTTASTQTPVPLWLDCDPGHDDAFAIILACSSPQLNCVGLSTVHGNAPLSRTTTNALSLLTAIGLPHIPVYEGAAAPLTREPFHAAHIHGESGIDGTTLLPTPTTTAAGKATDGMWAALQKAGPVTTNPDGSVSGGLWIVATGTFTNVVLLLRAHPEAEQYIRGISLMGGAFGNPTGNVVPHGEFNVFADPHAAKELLENPVLQGRLYLIPLDLTHTVLADATVRERLLNGESRGLRRMLHDLLMYFASTYEQVFGLGAGPPLHDPLAVAVLLKGVESDLWEEGRWVDVVVDEEGEFTGRTVAGEPKDGHKGGVWLPTGVNVPKFWNIMLECVDRCEERVGKGKVGGDGINTPPVAI
ncbi:Inosine/uridine-preferring nucleoside hydrolase [Ascobolus immersus RN42]|uniref:Inosine/uridine-preferring nucleoside hydrolase n=1 Tax=Ascobolus immersus RN42 TaxID=1160509 RepID=A0A3N4INE9_ASCIM|nr:Inosine/uridine-preferring nucleoside hydrolase [Ascobolus immersus RN42]